MVPESLGIELVGDKRFLQEWMAVSLDFTRGSKFLGRFTVADALGTQARPARAL